MHANLPFLTSRNLVTVLINTARTARDVKKKMETTRPWFLSTIGISAMYHIFRTLLHKCCRKHGSLGVSKSIQRGDDDDFGPETCEQHDRGESWGRTRVRRKIPLCQIAVVLTVLNEVEGGSSCVRTVLGKIDSERSKGCREYSC